MDYLQIVNFKTDFRQALPQEYFLQKTETIAKDLIGKYLVKIECDHVLAARIVETEAYLSSGDLSSHSATGQTKRNEAMFEIGGVLYVYKIYGIHHCANVVSEKLGTGSAILLRAAEPILGIPIMSKNRGTNNIKILCKGPGNLAKSFGLNTTDNKRPVYEKDFFIQSDGDLSDNNILITKRIGISKSKDLPLRFILKNSAFVSGRKK